MAGIVYDRPACWIPMAHPDSTHPCTVDNRHLQPSRRYHGSLSIASNDAIQRQRFSSVWSTDRRRKCRLWTSLRPFFLPTRFSLPGGRRFLFKYDAFELRCALKPFAIAHVAEQHGAAKLLYLDSDILVLSSFWNYLEAAWGGAFGATYAASPYSCPAMYHWNFSARWHNTALITAVSSRLTANAEIETILALLEQSARSRLCTFDPMNNIYVDQRWLDLLTASSDHSGSIAGSRA